MLSQLHFPDLSFEPPNDLPMTSSDWKHKSFTKSPLVQVIYIFIGFLGCTYCFFWDAPIIFEFGASKWPKVTYSQWAENINITKSPWRHVKSIWKFFGGCWIHCPSEWRSLRSIGGNFFAQTQVTIMTWTQLYSHLY